VLRRQAALLISSLTSGRWSEPVFVRSISTLLCSIPTCVEQGQYAEHVIQELRVCRLKDYDSVRSTGVMLDCLHEFA
jgi:hypothetical protein